MRWAFWRRKRRQQPAGVAEQVASCWTLPAAAQDEPDDPEPRPAATAFSGALPGPPPALTPGIPRSPLAAVPSEVDPRPARAVVARLAAAAQARDVAAVQTTLRELTDVGGDHLQLACVGALAALGPRLATLAGYQGDPLAPGGPAWQAAVTQGDVTAGRAERTRRAAAPAIGADLLRYAVRFACGTPDADPALARLADVPAADLLLAAAVLLAQTAQDGAAPLDALPAELAELLPES